MKKFIVIVVGLFIAFPAYAGIFGLPLAPEGTMSSQILPMTYPDGVLVPGDYIFHVDALVHGQFSDEEFNQDFVWNIPPNANISSIIEIDERGEYKVTVTPPENARLDHIDCDSTDESDVFTPMTHGIDIVINSVRATITCKYFISTTVKTPILIIPGVLGTNIKSGDDLLWANKKMANPFGSDSFMDALGFDENFHPIDPRAAPTNVIRNSTVLGFGSHYTDFLINDFITQGYVEGENLFTFPYDWRYGVTGGDNLNIHALERQIRYIIDQTQAGIEAGKVDVIAHSTGGLLLKQYILDNPTDHHVGKAVMVGVPNLGSPKALKVLLAGDSFNVFGLSDSEMKKISKNMPVVYELAPTVEYYTLAGSYYKILDFNLPIFPDKVQFLDHDEANQELIDLDLANESAVRSSENLHSTDFDNLDLRKFGVDVSNLVGCKSATFSSVIETRPIGGQKSEFDIISHTTGDGTVPLISAQTIPADPSQVFFIPEAKHGSLLTDNGPRQKIVNILTGANLDTDDKVLTHDEVAADPKLCQIKGEEIKIKSPVDISVIDQDGNHSGLIEDGSIENSIPGADFEIWGDHKYMFLPTDEGQQYSISLKGTGNGTFTLQDQKIEGDTIIQTQNFINIPVTTSLSGNLDISDISDPKLNLDNDSDGVIDIQLSPTSVVDGESGADIIPPQTTASISGTAGNENFYRSDVSVSLAATDPGVNASGVLKTEISLDGSDYADYTGPITFNTEGVHTIKFYSSDKMGNNEGEKSLSFTIDKQAPEINFAFDPGIMDLTFAGTDNISAQDKISIVDSDSSVRATDEAGNTTVITFKGKNRKKNMSAEIQSIAYNGVPADIGKSSFRFIWNTDKKKGTLKNLEQIGRSKKDFMITATYAGGKTLLVGHDSTGFVFSKDDNLTILHFVTNAGDISWSR